VRLEFVKGSLVVGVEFGGAGGGLPEVGGEVMELACGPIGLFPADRETDRLAGIAATHQGAAFQRPSRAFRVLDNAEPPGV
jgi:hypothetical protein